MMDLGTLKLCHSLAGSLGIRDGSFPGCQFTGEGNIVSIDPSQPDTKNSVNVVALNYCTTTGRRILANPPILPGRHAEIRTQREGGLQATPENGHSQ